MRTFTKFEQDIIKQMVAVKNLNDRFAPLIFINNLDFVAVEWNSDYSEFTIIQGGENNTSTTTVYDRICEILFLFKYLESNLLIGWYNNPKIATHKKNDFYDQTRYGKDGNLYFRKKDDGSEKYFSPIILLVYSDIGLLFDKYANSAFYISEALRELVDNDFKTESQRQFNEMRKITGFSILVAVVIGILSVFLNLTNQTTYDVSAITNRLDSLNYQTKEIHNLFKMQE